MARRRERRPSHPLGHAGRGRPRRGGRLRLLLGDRASLLRGDRPQLRPRDLPDGARGPDVSHPAGARRGRPPLQPPDPGRRARGHAGHPVQRARGSRHGPGRVLVPHRGVRRPDRPVPRGLGRGAPRDLRPLRQRHLPGTQGAALRDPGAEARAEARPEAASPALGGGDEQGHLRQRRARGPRRARASPRCLPRSSPRRSTPIGPPSGTPTRRASTASRPTSRWPRS